ncbi:MAG: hypothetical protein DDG59_11715 [Anaerolineae bacterium]|jgi:hypothetical protein|nr:MAG: hypothetical protein DDG59_11715 [Anaerolineae bacterium]
MIVPLIPFARRQSARNGLRQVEQSGGLKSSIILSPSPKGRGESIFITQLSFTGIRVQTLRPLTNGRAKPLPPPTPLWKSTQGAMLLPLLSPEGQGSLLLPSTLYLKDEREYSKER